MKQETFTNLEKMLLIEKVAELAYAHQMTNYEIIEALEYYGIENIDENDIEELLKEV